MIFVPDTNNEYRITQGTDQAIGVAHWIDNPSGWLFKAQIRSVTGELIHEWPAIDLSIHQYVLFLPCDSAKTSLWSWSAAQLLVNAISPQGEVSEIARNPIEMIGGIV